MVCTTNYVHEVKWHHYYTKISTVSIEQWAIRNLSHLSIRKLNLYLNYPTAIFQVSMSIVNSKNKPIFASCVPQMLILPTPKT